MELKITLLDPDYLRTLTDLTHWCRWCGANFSVKADPMMLRKIEEGEMCVRCTTCKLFC